MGFAHHIEAFSIQSIPVQTDGNNVKVCWLDDLKRFKAQLLEVSQDFDAMRNRVKEKEGAFIKAMDCQHRAILYGIQKLPLPDVSEDAHGNKNLSLIRVEDMLVQLIQAHIVQQVDDASDLQFIHHFYGFIYRYICKRMRYFTYPYIA